jgi:hypothetical protein
MQTASKQLSDTDKATSAKLTEVTTEAGFPSKVVSKP